LKACETQLCWFAVCAPWLCISLQLTLFRRNHAQLRGDSVAERLMSTLAYGWVERCSGVAGCELILHQKISTAGYFISVIYIDVKC